MTVADVSTSATYDAHAPYYDAFTSRSDYEAWASAIWRRRRPTVSAASGSWTSPAEPGRSFVPFLRRGSAVPACDCSPAMVAEAARRAPAAHLVHVCG